MIARRLRDGGQAFPIYIVVIAGMLFAALAFFVISQAGVTRSSAQAAADAAALAAARDARDHLVPGLDFTKFEKGDWEKILRGDLLDPTGACDQARSFAEQNGASATCTASSRSYTVEVSTHGTVGSSVIPGTGGMHGEAKATASIEPRCHLGSAPSTDPSPATPSSVEFTCKGGKSLKLDPTKPESWRTLARSLFDVRLVD
ncbi:pilus assembly protein TadG-related protein [Streptomyces sp. NPDC058279]|uniref:pilus assembly protein TadG-related protein n=1 Tax=Streptomyces sp. NPDC058279 TaxID=3346418 RepID=UPI0036E40EA5